MDKLAFALFYFYYYENDELDNEVSLFEDIQKHWANWPKIKEKATQQFLSESELRRDIDRFEAIAAIISTL